MTNEPNLPELEQYPPILTTSEVAQILRLRGGAVAASRLIARGDLRGTKVGKEWRVRRSDLARMLLDEGDVAD